MTPEEARAAAALIRAIDQVEYNDGDIVRPLPGWPLVRQFTNSLARLLEDEPAEGTYDHAYLRGWNACRASVLAKLGLLVEIEEPAP